MGNSCVAGEEDDCTIKMNSSRNNTLDILKGIAIISIIITHFAWTASQRMNIVFPYYINMAVPIFMFVSGYVGALSLERNHVSTFSEAYSKDILVKKLLRYLIPYFIIVAWNILDPNIHIDILNKGIVRWIMSGTDGQGSYYFPVLIQFVFIFPLIYFLIERKRQTGLWICLFIDILYGVFKWAWGMNYDFWRNMIFRYVFIIGMGVFFRKEEISRKNSVYITVLGGGFIFLTTYSLLIQNIVSKWFDWTGACCFAAMWISPLLGYLVRHCHWKCGPLGLIGKCSYEIFLFQMGFYLAYDLFIQKYFPNQWIHLLFNIIICCCMGMILHMIDEMIIKWCYRRLEGHKILGG